MILEGRYDDLDPFVDVQFEGQSQSLKVLVDTGFTGEMMLQRSVIDDLGLDLIGEDVYTTASGDEVTTTIHLGVLNWMGSRRRIAVLATEGRTALLGMGLLFPRTIHMQPSQGILRIE